LGPYVRRSILAALTFALLLPVAPPTVRAAWPGVDGRIAYVGYAPVPGDDDNTVFDAIFTSNPDGSARRLVPNTGSPSGEVVPRHPAWSPDGQRIAFVSETDSVSTIVVIKPDGTDRLELAQGDYPAWTADGQWVSYSSPVDLDLASTSKVPAAGGDAEPVVDGYNTRWSPDGARIAFQRGWWPDIFVRDLVSGDEVNLTPNGNETFDWLGDWSPDSQKVVFSSSGAWPDPGSTLVANADGSSTTPLLSPATDAAWSPSGSHFIASGSSGDEGILQIFGSDGSLERTVDINGMEPVWGSAPLLPAGDTRPDKCSRATTSSEKGTWLKDTINSSTDEDWYRFSVTRKTRVQVTLGALPENYRLDLYSTCSTRLATSNRGGREFEEILKRLPAGTYRVRVSGTLSSGTPYQLRFRQLADGLPVLSSFANLADSFPSDFVGEVLNNTSSNRTQIEVKLRFFNRKGSLIGSAKGSLGAYILKPGARLPFHFRATVSNSVARVTAKVSSSSTTTASPVSLSVTSNPPWTMDGVCTPELCPDYFDENGNVIDEDLTLHYDGTVHNPHPYKVHAPRIAATFYDSRGYVRDAYYLRRSDSNALASGKTVTWTVSQWELPNRATFVGIGLR